MNDENNDDMVQLKKKSIKITINIVSVVSIMMQFIGTRTIQSSSNQDFSEARINLLFTAIYLGFSFGTFLLSRRYLFLKKDSNSKKLIEFYFKSSELPISRFIPVLLFIFYLAKTLLSA